MAECIVLKGGGGADLDVITAVAPDVLAGKVILDKDGNPLPGTMPNRGAISQALGINGTYTIPAGYHNGSGKVTQSIATMGAQTINPTASQQIVSTSGKYLTGNVTVNGVSNLTAANIKKGVNVGGTIGTWEGYVPGAQDLYYRGNNVIGWTSGSGWSFQAGQISVSGASNNGSGTFSTVGKSYLNIEGSTNGVAGTSAQSWTLERYNGGWINVGSVSWNEHGYYTKSINVANAQVAGNFRLTGHFTQDTIFRIWLS